MGIWDGVGTLWETKLLEFISEIGSVDIELDGIRDNEGDGRNGGLHIRDFKLGY